MNGLPDADNGAVVVRADHVARTFGSESRAVVAVNGVSCRVHPGERIVLTGPSGSGKTTLLHLLAGLDTPTLGTVTWPALEPGRPLRPGYVGIVFQGPSLLPPLNVLENVALPMLLLGEDRATAGQRAHEALGRLGLDQLADRVPEDLSAGQAQRVAVARALVCRPSLILADEPTGQLDHANASTVIDALLDASRETGAALIVNTHDTALADRFSQHWFLRSGRLTTSQPVGVSTQ